jgi:co-chaperonin GroES (HSP10)
MQQERPMTTEKSGEIPKHRMNFGTGGGSAEPDKPAHTEPAAPRRNEPSEPVVKKIDYESVMDHLDEIPQVLGYRVLLIPVQLGEFTKGGIALPDEVRNSNLLHAQIFRVAGMGSLAYRDNERFPTGPWCSVGDYVYIGRYAGTKISTQYCDELRIVNDDEIQAIVPDVDDTLDVV